ncbi:hypothetical protein KKH18_07955 [bacterium]|nr:hypothetical protein [bacterium]
MFTIIGAGGSGARVVEAVVHLCAAGLGPDTLRILLIDPDRGNGNASRLGRMLTAYFECRKRFQSKKLNGLDLFSTDIELLGMKLDQAGLEPWSPVSRKTTLSEMLNTELLSKSGIDPDVLKLFYDKEELKSTFDYGFLGRPAIGAAAMSMIRKHQHKPPWNQLAEYIQNDTSRIEGSRIMITGSVFGATGASAIHPLLRYLRSIPDENPSRLIIGVMALLPYFSFAVDKETIKADKVIGEIVARADDFAFKTKTALEYYHYLRTTHEGRSVSESDWPNALYWLGDNDAIDVKFSRGGPTQINQSSAIDLFSGLTCLGFFFEDSKELNGTCCYAGPRQDAFKKLGTRNPKGWEDIPFTRSMKIRDDDIRRSLLKFWLTGAYHLGFCEELRKTEDLDLKPYCVPWYYRNFHLKHRSLRSEPAREALTQLSTFFNEFHFPWWKDLLASDECMLFNKLAFTNDEESSSPIDLNLLQSLLWKSAEGSESPLEVDKYFSLMTKQKVPPGLEEMPAYLTILSNAASAYIRNEYPL